MLNVYFQVHAFKYSPVELGFGQVEDLEVVVVGRYDPIHPVQAIHPTVSVLPCTSYLLLGADNVLLPAQRLHSIILSRFKARWAENRKSI